jgi:hypothetical protein
VANKGGLNRDENGMDISRSTGELRRLNGIDRIYNRILNILTISVSKFSSGIYDMRIGWSICIFATIHI